MLKISYWPETQREIANCPIRYLGIFAGRRWGKSHVLRARSMINSIRRPGFRYWYIAPQYAQVIEQFEATLSEPSFAPRIRKTKLQPYPRIFLRNGSMLAYRSFERPKSLRGSGLDGIDVDEIQDIDEEHFWPVIRPLISDRRGSLALAGQFRGKNWYYDRFYERGQDPKYAAEYKSWRLPAATGLKYQGVAGRAELESARSMLPHFAFRVEYECDPLSNQKAALDPDDVNRMFGAGVPELPGPRQGCTYIAGVDLGRVKDHTAVVVVEVQTGLVAHAERLPLGMKHEAQAPLVARIVNRYGALPVVDCTGGATGGHETFDAHLKFYKKFLPNLRPFYWNAKNKEDVCCNLLLYIEQHRLHASPTFEGLKKELLAFEVEPKSGRYDFHAGSGAHDDYVAALAKAAWGVEKKWGASTTGSPLSALW